MMTRGFTYNERGIDILEVSRFTFTDATPDIPPMQRRCALFLAKRLSGLGPVERAQTLQNPSAAVTSVCGLRVV